MAKANPPVEPEQPTEPLAADPAAVAPSASAGPSKALTGVLIGIGAAVLVALIVVITLLVIPRGTVVPAALPSPSSTSAATSPSATPTPRPTSTPTPTQVVAAPVAPGPVEPAPVAPVAPAPPAPVLPPPPAPVVPLSIDTMGASPSGCTASSPVWLTWETTGAETAEINIRSGGGSPIINQTLTTSVDNIKAFGDGFDCTRPLWFFKLTIHRGAETKTALLTFANGASQGWSSN